MRFDGWTVARLAALIFGSVLIQITSISQITVLGSSADLAPLIVVSLGLLAGPEIGAAMGFAVGLFVDMALLQTLGVSSLLFLVIGYAGGRYSQLRDPTATLVPVAAGATATLAAASGYSVIQFLLGIDAPVSALLMREIAVTIALNTLISVPVFLAVRRILSPALKDEVLPRRRRRRSTGTTAQLSRR